MNKELKEALKEIGRVVLLSILPILISMLENWRLDWKVLAIVAGTALLRGVDKYIHLNEKSGVSGGLTNF